MPEADDQGIHAPRRAPTAPEGPVDLQEIGDDLLAQAAELDAGRAARTLTPGAGAPLKQTILALAAGRRLQEHTAPGPATLHVLRGTVVLGVGQERQTVLPGMWAPIPERSHDLEAVSDSIVLLTVAQSPAPS